MLRFVVRIIGKSNNLSYSPCLSGFPESEMNWTKLLFWSVLSRGYHERWRQMVSWCIAGIIWPRTVWTSKPPLTGWRRVTKVFNKALSAPLLPRDLSLSQQPVYSLQSRLSTVFSLMLFISGVWQESTWSEQGEKSVPKLRSCCWYIGWEMDKT